MALLLRQNNSFEPNIGVLAQQICLIKSAAKFVNEYDSCPLLWRDFEYHRFQTSFPFSGGKKAAGMNLRLKLVRLFVLGGVFRIPSVYLMGETAKKGKV